MRRSVVSVAAAVSLAAAVVVVSGGVAQAASSQVTFRFHTDFATGRVPYSVVVGDLNGDGHLDLATANYDADSVSVLLGDGTGHFGPKADFAAGRTPQAVALGDLNGDGHLDLAVANAESSTVSVLLGDGMGAFGTPTAFPTEKPPRSLALGDLNGDGFLDLAATRVSSPDTVSVLLGNGTGGFGMHTDFETGESPAAVAVADLNGDGILDLATANEGVEGGVSVLLGDGTGRFGAHIEFATGTPSHSVAVGDMNGDSALDLVVTNIYANSVSVLLGDGTGGFGAHTDFATGALPVSVAVGDLNGDGIVDLAVANGGSPNVSVLVGDGSGGLGAHTEFAAPTPRFVTVRDVNGDGLSDLVVANSGSDSVSVLLNAIGGPGGIAATPANGLEDGQSVAIDGFGWVPGHTIGFCQAVVVGPPSASNCDGGVYGQVVADGGGNFSVSLVMKRTIDVPSLGGLVNCADPATPCVTGAADIGDVSGTAVSVPLQFAGVPGAPTIVKNATPGNGSATISWTAPANQGGSPITGYVVTAYVGLSPVKMRIFNSTATTQTVTGLTNETQYRFRVRAYNTIGVSGFSKVTNPVTPTLTAPDAPLIGTAQGGDSQATVSWTAPASDGGSPITGYVVTAYVGLSPVKMRIFNSTATTQTVTGLTNGTQYRFRVRAYSALGVSGFSKVTNPVTPTT